MELASTGRSRPLLLAADEAAIPRRDPTLAASIPSVSRAYPGTLLPRDRDSDGDGAYRLLGSLTAASQLTSVMLAETASDKQPPEQDTSSRFGERTREPAARSAPTARGTAPTTTSGGERHPPGCGVAGHCPRAGGRPRTGRRDPVRHRGSCRQGNVYRAKISCGSRAAIRQPP